MTEMTLRSPIFLRVRLTCDCGRKLDRTLVVGAPDAPGSGESCVQFAACVRACGRRHRLAIGLATLPVVVTTEGPETADGRLVADLSR